MTGWVLSGRMPQMGLEYFITQLLLQQLALWHLGQKAHSLMVLIFLVKMEQSIILVSFGRAVSSGEKWCMGIRR